MVLYAPFNILLFSFAVLSMQKEVIGNEKCKTCKFLVATFEEGLKKTARQHFAGGDTAWEEKNLGTYKTSETRLIEVLEGVCKKATISDANEFTNDITNIEFKCASQLESNEELIEEYYYKHQQNNMTNWLCIDGLKLCCPSGHFGKSCEMCPGVKEGAPACYGRGQCHGNGSRDGNGKCKCDAGYTGNVCRYCDSEYFEESRSETSVTCKKCYEGCLGSCNGDGPKGCTKCKIGWTMNKDGEGCIDTDECLNKDSCTKPNEVCVNTVGSYRCDCQEGFKRDTKNNCQLDIEAGRAEKEQEESKEEDEKDEL